ncbi:hypothetical protein SUGI_1108440 [Cryptomeria japonica]|nr:hypothetical protein SUGI_1108440 [Cryptomeria japonica]
MDIHGYEFYVVGEGLGNYNAQTDPVAFNLIDPPLRNTVEVPVGWWSAIRFKADNPGNKRTNFNSLIVKWNVACNKIRKVMNDYE